MSGNATTTTGESQLGVRPGRATADDRSRIDVTGLETRNLPQLADSAVSMDDVSLEHRGGRTYVLVG